MTEEMVDVELWITYRIPSRMREEFRQDSKTYTLSSFIEVWMQFYEDKISSEEDFDKLLEEARDVQNPSS